MGWWTDVAILERVSKFAPYVFIILGFLIAIAGQFVRASVDSRIKSLKGEAERQFKLTPPQILASLATDPKTPQPPEAAELVVEVEALNLIPFKAHWAIVTRGGRYVSGVMLEDLAFHPTEAEKIFGVRTSIQAEQVVDEYLELQLAYESLFAPEVGRPPQLRGTITTPFRYRNRRVFAWIEQPLGAQPVPAGATTD